MVDILLIGLSKVLILLLLLTQVLESLDRHGTDRVLTQVLEKGATGVLADLLVRLGHICSYDLLNRLACILRAIFMHMDLSILIDVTLL